MVENPVKESKNFINVGVLVNAKGEVLIARRVKEETGKNGKVLRWAFPGGKQRFGESRNEGVKREVFDETGYSIVPVREISMRAHPEIPVIVVYHLCKLEQPQQIKDPGQPWEIAEIKWVKPEELREYFTTSLDPKVAQELKIA